MLAALKGILVSNILLRFYLAKPLSPKVGKSTKWIHDARLLDPEEMRSRWTRVCQCFVQNGEYRSYDMAILLAGEHTVKHLLVQGVVKICGQVDPSSTSMSGWDKGKQGREDEKSNKDDTDLMIVQYIPDRQAGPSTVRRRTHR